MSLNLSKLEKVRELANGGVEARCPACAEAGHDRKGEHLLIEPDGRFGCCANANDREHRKRIFALAGDTAPQSIKVKPAAVRVAAPIVISGVLGRLGRMFASPIKPHGSSDASDGAGEVRPEENDVRTVRTGEMKSSEPEQQESRTPRTPQYSLTYREKNRKEDTCVELQGVPVGVSEASEIGSGHPFQPEFGKAVRGVRMPYVTPGGTLVIPFNSPERFHWWKGGQSVQTTAQEVGSLIQNDK